MRRLYLGLSLGIVALGLVHFAATFKAYPAVTGAAIWFASGGMLMILTGVVNLLQRSYGRLAPGLRVACIGANIVMATLATVAGKVGHASALLLVIVIGLFVGVTVLSLMPGARQSA